MLKLLKALRYRGTHFMWIETRDGLSCEAKFSSGKSILEAALTSGIEIPNSCGGMGTCGTCRIEFIEGGDDVDPPNEIELETAREKNFKKSERLACQIVAIPGCRVRVL